jgi:hypothetical protein
MNTHSDNFKKFLSQLNAKGYERSQGFDLNLLKKLNPNEQSLAVNYLQKILEKGDPTAAPALAAIGNFSAKFALESKLNNLSAPSLLHSEISLALLKITNDQKFQTLLLKNLKEPDKLKKLAILQGILSITPSDELRKELINLVKSDTEGAVRALAAAGVLYCKGKIKNPKDYNHPYLSLLKDIASQDSNIKKQAIDNLMSEIQ